MINKFINVIKPTDLNSTKVVTAVKRIFKCPVGHMGTLDPMASGVLPIGINKATRLFNYLLDKEKEYIANFTFGYETDTLDITGKIVNESGVIPTEEEIRKKLGLFIGKIDQIPPKYSAKNINGKRSYELARLGKEVVLKPKAVQINSIELLGQVDSSTYSFKINCQGGTYIRSICRDLGLSLNTYATMSRLDRVKSGIFTYANAIKYEDLLNVESIESLTPYLIDADTVLDYKVVVLTEEEGTKILNGVFKEYDLLDGYYKVYKGEEFFGIGLVENKILKVKSYVR